MYKNNSGLIVKTKVIKYKKGLRLTEKLVFFIRYVSYTRPLAKYIILPQSTLIKVFFYVQEFSNRIIK